MKNNNMVKRYLELSMGILMIAVIYSFSTRTKQETISVYNQTKDKIVVMVDAGHGGNDPGKVSINNDLEKDINLQIALKLEEILKGQDIEVVMTRRDDSALYEEGVSNKKNSDMRKRVELSKEKNVDLIVSIHSNSYIEESVCGAQVFYFKGSEDGKLLAESIQDDISKVSVLNNKRVAKVNSDYYLLRNVTAPAVIVECGFLSNVQEAALLKNNEYQRKIAWSIHLGIMEYINKKY